MKKICRWKMFVYSLLGGLVLERIWYFYPASFPKFLIPPVQNFVLLFADTEESADNLSILTLIAIGAAIVASFTFLVKWLLSLKKKPPQNI
jgi:hypothetical protein